MTLHLTLKKKWFGMILSGEKKEEYRDMKDYWKDRLMHYDIGSRNNNSVFKKYTEFKSFDTITFKNGYSANAPEMVIECKGITIGEGKPEWGAEPGKQYFILSLGEILSTKNINL